MPEQLADSIRQAPATRGMTDKPRARPLDSKDTIRHFRCRKALGRDLFTGSQNAAKFSKKRAFDRLIVVHRSPTGDAGALPSESHSVLRSQAYVQDAQSVFSGRPTVLADRGIRPPAPHVLFASSRLRRKSDAE